MEIQRSHAFSSKFNTNILLLPNSYTELSRKYNFWFSQAISTVRDLQKSTNYLTAYRLYLEM